MIYVSVFIYLDLVILKDNLQVAPLLELLLHGVILVCITLDLMLTMFLRFV